MSFELELARACGLVIVVGLTAGWLSMWGDF